MFLALLLAAKFVTAADGVRIWYNETGRGTPVIVIHGGPGMDHESLARDLTPLEQHHRVIEYDQRGGGIDARMTRSC
jgi:proline iminopeptidase